MVYTILYYIENHICSSITNTFTQVMCHLYVITGGGADSDGAGCHQQDQARVSGVVQVATCITCITCPVFTCVCLSECFNIVNVFFIYTSKSMKFNGLTSKFNIK